MCMKNQNVISFIVYRHGAIPTTESESNNDSTPILESESESESFVVSLWWSRNRSQNRGYWHRSRNRGDWNRSRNRGNWNRSRNRGDWNRIRMTIPISHMYRPIINLAV